MRQRQSETVTRKPQPLKPCRCIIVRRCICALKLEWIKKSDFETSLTRFPHSFFFFFIVVFFKFYFREKEFPRRLSTSRGGVLGDGVQTEIISYSYACTPVELGTDRGKEYMVCVALAKGDTGEKYASRLISE